MGREERQVHDREKAALRETEAGIGKICRSLHFSPPESFGIL